MPSAGEPLGNDGLISPAWRQFFSDLIDQHFIDGNGSPEGVVSAGIGAMYIRRDGGAGTVLYVKESGTGNTGWVAK